MGQPHRIGIIGLGVISGQYLDTLLPRDDVRITAVADLDHARAVAVADPLPHASAMTVAELLTSDEVDIVLNLTTPGAHAQIAMGAIAAGKDVYGEKPLATAFGEAKRMVASADAAGVRLGCAPDTVLGTGVQTARAVIDGGEIGMPLAASAVMASPGHERWHPNPDFYYQPGGGPLLDMGPYYIAALVHLLGPVVAVVGAGSQLRGERTIATGPRAGERVAVEVDTHVTGVLEHQGGVLSTVTTSFDSVATRARNIEVHGELASLSVPDPNHSSGAVEIYRLGASAWDVVAPSAGLINGARGVGLLDLVATPRGVDSRASGRFALHALEVMTALLESAQTGHRVTLETTVARPPMVPLTSA